MIKVLGAMAVVIACLSAALYFQIKASGEQKAALKAFQSAYAAQVEENQKINQLIVERDRANRESLKTIQELKRRRYEISAKSDPQDCINQPVPDALRLLDKRSDRKNDAA